MAEFIIDINLKELSDATKKELEEIIKELKPGTIKMIYQVIDGNLVEFYVRANRKGDIFMGKPGLSEADKQWIAGLIRPIQKDISEIKDRLDNVEKRLDRIENCPTIKNEINNK